MPLFCRLGETAFILRWVSVGADIVGRAINSRCQMNISRPTNFKQDSRGISADRFADRIRWQRRQNLVAAALGGLMVLFVATAILSLII